MTGKLKIGVACKMYTLAVAFGKLIHLITDVTYRYEHDAPPGFEDTDLDEVCQEVREFVKTRNVTDFQNTITRLKFCQDLKVLCTASPIPAVGRAAAQTHALFMQLARAMYSGDLEQMEITILEYVTVFPRRAAKVFYNHMNCCSELEGLGISHYSSEHIESLLGTHAKLIAEDCWVLWVSSWGRAEYCLTANGPILRAQVYGVGDAAGDIMVGETADIGHMLNVAEGGMIEPVRVLIEEICKVISNPAAIEDSAIALPTDQDPVDVLIGYVYLVPTVIGGTGQDTELTTLAKLGLLPMPNPVTAILQIWEAHKDDVGLVNLIKNALSTETISVRDDSETLRIQSTAGYLILEK